MISLIMPYWDRLELLRLSLSQLSRLYTDLDMEIIIANDGSPLLERRELPIVGLNVTLINMEEKPEAKNPCLPLNLAASYASGKFLAITNPEIVHEEPVLEGLRHEVMHGGPKHYCSAAVWSVDTSRWYNHSEGNDKRLGRAPMPRGSGLHFLSMMHRELFESIGGFDEMYRDGQGYEDSDFLWKLHRADATFSIRDDLVVFHHGTRTKWPIGGIERNRRIFNEKWGEYIESVV